MFNLHNGTIALENVKHFHAYFGFVGFPENFRLFQENFYTLEVYKNKTACYSSVSNFPVFYTNQPFS